MSYFDIALLDKSFISRNSARAGAGVLIAALLGSLAGCNKEPQKSGQAIAKVNGEEITILQLNEELRTANVQKIPQESVRPKVLESLIDRQLLQDAAARDKIDRAPEVVKAIERAKSVIIAQAYMQKRLQSLSKPTKEEVQAYFEQNPNLFAKRQQFDLLQLVILQEPAADVVEKLKNASTLDESAAILSANGVKFLRNEVFPTSTELAPELVEKLKAMPANKLFMLKQEGRASLMTVAGIKEVPVDLELATPAIEQHLMGLKSKEAATAELARLRASAKIEYLDKSVQDVRKTEVSEAAGKSRATADYANLR